MAQLVPYLKFKAVDDDGVALVGGRVFTYIPGTSTPKATYTDHTQGATNTNPIILNALGECDINVDGPTDIVLQNADATARWGPIRADDPTKDTTLTSITIAGDLIVSSTTVNWAGNPAHAGNHAFNGTVTFNSNVTIGDSLADSLTIKPNLVSWPNNPTHSDNHIFAGNVQVVGIFSANSYVGQVKAVSKTASTARSSTTTAADDPHLTLALAVGVHSFEVFVPVWSTTATTGGLKVQMGFSGTASADFYSVAFETGTLQPVHSVPLAQFSSTVNASTAMIVGTVVNGAGWVRLCGSLNISVTGNLTFKWAQNSSDANAANVGIGGYMMATRLT